MTQPIWLSALAERNSASRIRRGLYYASRRCLLEPMALRSMAAPSSEREVAEKREARSTATGESGEKGNAKRKTRLAKEQELLRNANY